MCVCAAEAYGTIGLGHSSVKTPGSILPIVSVKLPPNMCDMFVFFVFNISYTAEKKNCFSTPAAAVHASPTVETCNIPFLLTS